MATETLTSGTSWTAPHTGSVLVECWGGGGAGGGNSTSTDGGGGGGGGAYARKLVSVTQGQSYAYSIGGGGTPSAGADGGNGGDTTWASTVVVAKGGVGGKAPVSGNGGVAGSGGLASASTGDQCWDGGWGTTGRDNNTGRGGGGGSSAGTAADGNNDGSAGAYATYTTTGRTAPTGGGAGGNGGTEANAGSAPAAGYGGGGGGSGDTDAAALAGGAGAAGKIDLTYFYEAPTAGTIRIVGQAPTVSQSLSVTPSVGTVAVVGQQPTLTASDHKTVSPTVGAVQIAGQQPTVQTVTDTAALVGFDTPTAPPKTGTDEQRFRVLVRKSDTANPTVDISLYEAGVLVAALVSATEVTSDSGQIIEAYWDASLLSDASGADVECYIYGHSNGTSKVEIGAVVWESRATANVTVAPDPGTLRITGQQPALAQTWSAAPTVGTLRLIGQQPSVGQTYSVSPSVGTVRVVGQQPTVQVTMSVAPSVGTVVIVGQQPTIAQTWSAAPQAGTLRVAGQQPSVGQTYSVAPESGTVRFSGEQPTIDVSGQAEAAPSTGTVRIVGQTPTVEGGVAISAGEQPTGGWVAHFRAEQEAERRREEQLRAEREREELAERLEQVLIEDGTLRQVDADLARLRRMVAQMEVMPNRAARAIRYAERAQSEFAVQLALKEVQRIAEEEEFAVLMALVLD